MVLRTLTQRTHLFAADNRDRFNKCTSPTPAVRRGLCSGHSWILYSVVAAVLLPQELIPRLSQLSYGGSLRGSMTLSDGRPWVRVICCTHVYYHTALSNQLEDFSYTLTGKLTSHTLGHTHTHTHTRDTRLYAPTGARLSDPEKP